MDNSESPINPTGGNMQTPHREHTQLPISFYKLKLQGNHLEKHAQVLFYPVKAAVYTVFNI